MLLHRRVKKRKEGGMEGGREEREEGIRERRKIDWLSESPTAQ